MNVPKLYVVYELRPAGPLSMTKERVPMFLAVANDKAGAENLALVTLKMDVDKAQVEAVDAFVAPLEDLTRLHHIMQCQMMIAQGQMMDEMQHSRIARPRGM